MYTIKDDTKLGNFNSNYVVSEGTINAQKEPCECFFTFTDGKCIKINNVTNIELELSTGLDGSSSSHCNFTFSDAANFIVEKSTENYNTDILKKERDKMKYVIVSFGTNLKTYIYKTELDLIIGAKYNILADGITTYNTPVTVIGYTKKPDYNIRAITHAILVEAPKRPTGNVKNIFINEQKKTVVVQWLDDTITKVRCHPDDIFDAEKGIAMCFMKRAYNNRGCYNETLKKYIKKE